MPKSIGLFIVPVVSVLIFLVFMALPRIDPLKSNVAKFRKHFDIFVFAVVAFMFYIHSLTVAWDLGARFDIAQLLSPVFAVLFYCIGGLCEKSRLNWFIGIRTPWTMSSDMVWDKTHKRGAKMIKIVAVLMLTGVVLPLYTFFLFIGLMVLVFAYLTVYSYMIYKKK